MKICKPPEAEPVMAEILEDPEYWGYELSRRLTARLIELEQRADEIFARRGTRKALSRILEIYTGVEPEILDLEEKADPFTFTVKVPLTESEVDRRLLERIVDASKPAHTNYELQFKKSTSKK